MTGATAAEDPGPDLAALAEAGIDLDDVTDQLLREGIDAFVVPMNKLLSGIEAKREAIVTGRPSSFEADLPPELEQPVAERLRKAAEEDVVRRIWRKDGTLWAAPGTPELEDRLGWLTIAEKLLEDLPRSSDFVREVREDGMTDVVLLGMGGSSLAPEVFRRSSPPSEGALRLHVLDSTEPLVGRGRRGRDRRRQHAVHRLVEVGRHDRAERAARVLPRAPARPAPLRRDHRPGHLDGGAGERRGLPAHVPLRPRDRRALLGAVAVRDRPRRAGRASTCRPCSRAPRSRRRTAS